MPKYDDESAAWQQGYDDFYDWIDDAYDGVDQYANKSDIQWPDHAEYHRGWDHANYEAAYEGYKLAKGMSDV